MPVSYLTQVRDDDSCIKAMAVGMKKGRTLTPRGGERKKLRKILRLLAWAGGAQFPGLPGFFVMMLAHLSEPKGPQLLLKR